MVTCGSTSGNDCSSSSNGISNTQHSHSLESLAEWRSSDQVENGMPSTRPPHWDSDDDGDSGPKPSDLFVKYTWKIENFTQISKRELRSDVFEASGYKWYILIYPQGCEACNHLSLFLCVANHDKLLPGWGHYALFTIAVLNKEPKKNKYNDTLHRFWKKEHDWGWKKFMEQTKINEGFIDEGTLTIKAQVQVIRLNENRPFRCLDFPYRRELIRVYLSNVEQICAKYVDERRQQLQKLISNKELWSSIQTFWFGIDQSVRCRMSRDKKDSVLKIVVKQFFIEKEVSSTIVMDALHSGLRALESQNKTKKSVTNKLEKNEPSAPYICIVDDMFVLADDVFKLLERAALELPRLSFPSKEEKSLINRPKDGCFSDEFNRGSIMHDEKRLTEVGRWTLEIFVLAHIFSSRVDLAYKEMVALKRQEELIREEEAAEQAESEKRDKRARKKQAKQRRNVRKNIDGGKDEIIQLQGSPDEENSEDISLQNEPVDIERTDVSDPIAEACSSSSSEIPNEHVDNKSSSFVDDSSSTCSTDSIHSIVNGPYKSKRRGKRQQNKDTRKYSASDTARLAISTGVSSCTAAEYEKRLNYLNDQTSKPKHSNAKKEEITVISGNKVIINGQTREETASISVTSEPSSSSTTFPTKSRQKQPSALKNDQVPTITQAKKPEPPVSKSTQKSLQVSKSNAPKRYNTQHPLLSRPSSAPATSPPKQNVPDSISSISNHQLSRTLSSATCSDAQSLEPQSYKNAIMGIKSAPASHPSTSTSSTALPQPKPSFRLNSNFPPVSVQQESMHNIIGGNSCKPNSDEDDFPHLDIINDLLDDEGGCSTFQREPYHHMNNGYYQFELPEYYSDEISNMVYDSFVPHNEFMELRPEIMRYSNGANALAVQNQWPIDGSTMDANGYSTAAAAAYGVGGYNMMYRPANGI